MHLRKMLVNVREKHTQREKDARSTRRVPPQPYTRHPLNHTPGTLHPTPYTLNSEPHTLHPTPQPNKPPTETPSPTPYTLHPAP